jgi:hypothetical protein
MIPPLQEYRVSNRKRLWAQIWTFRHVFPFYTMNASSSSRDDSDMVDLIALCRTRGVYLAGFVLLTALLLVLGSQPTAAQSYRDPPTPTPGSGTEHRQGDTGGQAGPSLSPSNLPDWAEPSRSGGATRSGGASSSPTDIQPQVRPKAPAPPDNPSRIPVDGGVALLAAAGAGYAVRKLSQEEDEEDPPA